MTMVESKPESAEVAIVRQAGTRCEADNPAAQRTDSAADQLIGWQCSANGQRGNFGVTDTVVPAQNGELRAGLVAALRGLGAVRSGAVERAVLAVPRHVFLPEVALEQAYAPEFALTTKRDRNGTAVSSVSAARIQAQMLEQAEIAPGMRVLEIGSGGYNAALIAELAGRSGEVTTVDIDPDVTGRAARLLATAGYGQVRVVTADGADGLPAQATYDRIIVTAEAADIAPAWVSQLTAGGRLVVPLRVRGLTRSVAFEPRDGYLTGLSYEPCGFVPLRGVGESGQRLAVLHDDGAGQVALRLDDGPEADADALASALRGAAGQAWSGVTSGLGAAFDDLDLWLATVLPGYAVLAATRQARDAGIVASSSPIGISAVVDGRSFAYLTLRDISGNRTLYEFGAHGHGPAGQHLAGQMAAQVRTWGDEHRHSRARFRADPAGTARRLAGLTVRRPHYQITISWPE
jgi:protein-L-isoaspartate(D-aspartate) O-methyltransferase